MEEQDTISIDYINIIKDLLLLRKEEQKTISINYNITIVLLPYVREQKYIHLHIYNHIFATVITVAKIYTLCPYTILFFAPERSGAKNI
jgi:hypothetical protein